VNYKFSRTSYLLSSSSVNRASFSPVRLSSSHLRYSFHSNNNVSDNPAKNKVSEEESPSSP